MPNDAILHVLATRKKLAWPLFKNIADTLLASLSFQSQGGFSPKHVRNRLLRSLISLGHCDFGDDAGELKLFCAPSVAVRLPLAGLPKIVLCGARSPESYGMINDLVRRTECSISIDNQIDHLGRLPDRISIQATTTKSLQSLCDLFGIKSMLIPFAWAVMSNTARLRDVLQALTWSNFRTPDWPRLLFDLNKLRFVENADIQDGLPSLERFIHPKKNTLKYFISAKHGRAECHVDWARYAVLAEAKRNILYFDSRAGYLAVPASVPLPYLISRAATLCSGFSPSLHSCREIGIHKEQDHNYDLYRLIPEAFALKLSDILGQEVNHFEIGADSIRPRQAKGIVHA